MPRPIGRPRPASRTECAWQHDAAKNSHSSCRACGERDQTRIEDRTAAGLDGNGQHRKQNDDQHLGGEAGSNPTTSSGRKVTCGVASSAERNGATTQASCGYQRPPGRAELPTMTAIRFPTTNSSPLKPRSCQISPATKTSDRPPAISDGDETKTGSYPSVLSAALIRGRRIFDDERCSRSFEKTRRTAYWR